MASRVANALLGEADTPASPLSVATAGQAWFDSLQDEIKHILLLDYGTVDAVEICPLILIVKTGESYGEVSGGRSATWAEIQANPNIEGDWDNLSGQTYDDESVTCYGVYLHQPGKGAAHVQDYGTYEEAKLKADAISAIIGVSVEDFTNHNRS